MKTLSEEKIFPFGLFLLAAVLSAGFLSLSGLAYAEDAAQPPMAVSALDPEKVADDIHQAEAVRQPEGAVTLVSEVTMELEKKMPSGGETPGTGEAAGGTPGVTPANNGGEPQSEHDHEKANAIAKIDRMEDPFKDETEVPELKDPFEGYNRAVFKFNDTVYTDLIDPVARQYKKVVPDDFRIALQHAFSNVESAPKLLSTLLQGELVKSARVVARLVINSTLGIGGFFDVAEKFNIHDVNDDLEMALQYHHFPTGPYVVLPFIGPSTVRGMFGQAGEAFLSPTNMIPGATVVQGIVSAGGEKINDVSFYLDDIKQLDADSLDKYESVRDFYHQYREGLVRPKHGESFPTGHPEEIGGSLALPK